MRGLTLLAAVAFAALQYAAGVRTDEAKYLLNIPYPHPPLVRTLLGFTDGFMGQETVWRLAFALLLTGAGLWMSHRQRHVRMLVWLSIPAVFLQAGSVMMAPLVAVQAVMFLVLLKQHARSSSAAEVGLLWLMTLLTSYQGLLLFPLVVALLWRAEGSHTKRIAAFVLPVAVLMLYTVSHPLSAASFLLQAGKDADLGASERLIRLLRLWVLGMGAIGAPLVLWALLWKRPSAVMATFALFTVYVLVGSFEYYAVFFAPFVLWALDAIEHRRVRAWGSLLVVTGVLTGITLSGFPPLSTTRSTMDAIRTAAPLHITALHIAGSFGHEWQYESGVPVSRYRATGAEDVGTVVLCRTECAPPTGEWRRLEIDGTFGVWQRTRL